MFTKIKRHLLKLSLASLLILPIAATSAVYAQTDSPLQQSVCGGAATLQLGDPQTCDDPQPEDNINNLITTVVDIFSAVVGIVAVLMILYGGFRYITAGGDSSKITSAQQTIIYAIVGLVIVALAQIVVRFVLNRAVTTPGA